MKMAKSRISLKRTLLFSTFVAVFLFSATALAADAPKSTDSPTNNPPPATSPKQPATSQNGGKNTGKNTATSQPATSPGTSPNNDPTSTPSDPTGSTANAPPTTVAITPTGNGPTTGNTGPMPTASTSTSKLGLPTLSLPNTAIPTYPAPTVPPTQNAPFMQHSTLPDGTVFIAVGAILGAFGAAVLVWRAVVAYLLHRSIARAALAQHAANDKGPFTAPPAPFYKYSDRDSSLNVGGAGLGGGSSVAGSSSARGVRRTNRGPTPSATPSQTNLFFSPTAPGASGLGPAGNRDSRLLPSGFYAAGSASPAGPGHGQSIGLSNLRPDSVVHGRSLGPSPPDSPSFGPMRTTPVPRNMSGSSVSLNRPASGRAPSAFLDDLLDDQPQLFPPGGPSHHHTYSQSSQSSRRY